MAIGMHLGKNAGPAVSAVVRSTKRNVKEPDVDLPEPLFEVFYDCRNIIGTESRVALAVCAGGIPSILKPPCLEAVEMMDVDQ